MLVTWLLLATLLPQRADSTLVVVAGRVIDVRKGSVEQNVTLVIREGRIVERVSGDRVVLLPPRARSVDARHLTLLPGLIDTHVHLTIAGRPRDNALATLNAGFTTVADLGSAAGAGPRLKRLIDADSMPGPNLITAGSWIGGKGGVCEFGGATIRGAEAARARAIADGANAAMMLKLCITGWLEPSVQHPDSVELTDPELDAIAAVAREGRIPLVAHAIGRAGVTAALRTGVRQLAHTPIVTSEHAAAIARNDVCVSTTMTTLSQSQSTAELQRSFQELRSAGVKLVLGTDAGVLPHGRNADELKTLSSLGLTPLQTLRTATSDAADCLRIPNYGDLTPGAPADIIGVAGDPLSQIDLLSTPSLVIKRGKVVR